MKDWVMERKVYLVVVAFIVFGGLYYYFDVLDDQAPLASSPISEVEEKQPVEGQQTHAPNNPELKGEQAEVIMVDVKGQIKLPGVYQATVGERVMDVINRAGGLTEQADQAQVNFAEHVQDEMVIYIPAKGEVSNIPSTMSAGNSPAGVIGQKTAKININTADESELQNLPGVGPAKAAAIVEYRTTNGPFKAVEDLKSISGIGDKTFEKLKDLIMIR